MPTTHMKLLEQTEQLLGAKHYSVQREHRFHPYVDAYADLYAEKNGRSLVIEIKALPETARVQVDTVQQVDRMARLSGAQGLLVTSGIVTDAARYYARDCTPPVLLDVGEV